ncbi:MAG: hypothetical protein PWR06_1995 [Thermoanaerobacteraceae bacterium]|jgi:hypothetical protein|nr:hypothetical protein [Thermoanaerobacteraceae bacterium]
MPRHRIVRQATLKPAPSLSGLKPAIRRVPCCRPACILACRPCSACFGLKSGYDLTLWCRRPSHATSTDFLHQNHFSFCVKGVTSMTKVTIDPGICGFPIIAYQISHIHVFSSMTDLKPFSNWIAILSPRSLLPGRPYSAYHLLYCLI